MSQYFVDTANYNSCYSTGLRPDHFTTSADWFISSIFLAELFKLNQIGAKYVLNLIILL